MRTLIAVITSVLLFSQVSYANHFGLFFFPVKTKIITTANGRSWADGTYASSCKAYLNPSSSRYGYIGATGDGMYTINVSGFGLLNTYCDMSGGGWTLVDAGGSACGTSSYVAKSANTTLNSTNTGSYTSTCGYIPNSLMTVMSQSATSVRLRAGAAPTSYAEAVSSGPNTLSALRNSGNWHNGGYAEFNNFNWNYTCASSATYWPDMYQSCGNGGGVHWMVYAGAYVYHSNTSGPVSYSSTWLK